jgi:antitoxin ParD1/3/4
MQKNTSVTLGPHYENFVAQQVSRGRFGTKSEAIRAALQLLEEREMKLSLLRRALVEGEESGTANYSLKSLIHSLDNESLG